MKVSALTKCKSLLNNSSHFNKILEVYDKNGKSLLRFTIGVFKKEQFNLTTALALQSTHKTAILKRQEKFCIAQTSPKRKTFLRNITSVLTLRDSWGFFYKFNPFNMTPLVYLQRNPFHRTVLVNEDVRRNEKSEFPSSPVATYHSQQSNYDVISSNFNQLQINNHQTATTTSNNSNKQGENNIENRFNETEDLTTNQHKTSPTSTTKQGDNYITFVTILVDHVHAIAYFCSNLLSKLLLNKTQQVKQQQIQINDNGDNCVCNESLQDSSASSGDTMSSSQPQVMMSSDIYVVSAIITTLAAFCLRYLKLIIIWVVQQFDCPAYVYMLC